MNRLILLLILVCTAVPSFSFRDFMSFDWEVRSRDNYKPWNLNQSIKTAKVSMNDYTGNSKDVQLTKIIQSEGSNNQPLYEDVAEIMLQFIGDKQISLVKKFDNNSPVNYFKESLPKQYMRVINEEIDNAVVRQNCQKSSQVAYYESKDGKYQLIENGNLFIFYDSEKKNKLSGVIKDSWKNINAEECFRLAQSLGGESINFQDKVPPFLLRWTQNIKKLYSPGIPKRNSGIALSDKAAKRLLKGAVWGSNASDVELLGYAKWGKNYIV